MTTKTLRERVSEKLARVSAGEKWNVISNMDFEDAVFAIIEAELEAREKEIREGVEKMYIEGEASGERKDIGDAYRRGNNTVINRVLSLLTNTETK